MPNNFQASWPALAGAVLGVIVGVGLHATRAQGVPTDVPAGGVVYTTASVCPPGFVADTSAQGRLIVGTSTATSVNASVNAPLSSVENRTHRHEVGFDVPLVAKAVDSSNGSNGAGAGESTYQVGTYSSQTPSGLPFVQLRVCRKP